eukprot:CAMPEP_0202386790 /NCGR_PEP_ID=MMETSP1127-20130417/68495_1 /ASSEMBLY_ACC=CAM_ASM_000462 /TAXON_ID=3047 /ORGANISM="Dunaliella tertiolecta, Strain CCMP1320" /LENGTH=116 /DNA_ID=CAMNT_0048987505 /DNA_START=167 /DNA_END=517 /DNA_ORIENTATION=+
MVKLDTLRVCEPCARQVTLLLYLFWRKTQFFKKQLVVNLKAVKINVLIGVQEVMVVLLSLLLLLLLHLSHALAQQLQGCLVSLLLAAAPPLYLCICCAAWLGTCITLAPGGAGLNL